MHVGKGTIFDQYLAIAEKQYKTGICLLYNANRKPYNLSNIADDLG